MARRFHRVRHHGGRALAGWKGSLGSALAGAGTGFALPYVASAVPQLSTYGWWAMPTALIAVGHFLKRKNPTIGGALLGIGGLQAYNAYLGSRGAKGYPSFSYADAGGTNYNDNIRTDAAPTMNTAQAAALLNGSAMGVVDSGHYYDAGFAEAGADEAYGLVD